MTATAPKTNLALGHPLNASVLIIEGNLTPFGSPMVVVRNTLDEVLDAAVEFAERYKYQGDLAEFREKFRTGGTASLTNVLDGEVKLTHGNAAIPPGVTGVDGKGTVESWGYIVTTRADALAADDLPEGMDERVNEYPGAFVIYDPDGGEEGFMIAGDNVNELIAEAVEHLELYVQ